MADQEMPSQNGPLEIYAGERPPTPDWFQSAVEFPFEEHFLTVDGYKVQYQTWGTRGNPGILFVHGNGAHAHWWDFVAPAFVEEGYYVAALTFPGMGDSDWRKSYTMDDFIAQPLIVTEAAGLFDNPEKPILIAHSFGGFISVGAISEYGDRFKQAIIVDSPVVRPDNYEGPKGPPRRNRPNKIYPSLKAALARFRLAPPQPCENHYAMDYIARYSLKQVTDEAGNPGWTWKFDPDIWKHFEFKLPAEDVLRAAKCPVDFVRGASSALVVDAVFEKLETIVPEETRFVSIEGANHHVMLDKPLEFIEVIKGLI
ncbi:MAG: alpha/beta hydrolase [Pseudomonadota bacterium]